MTSAPVVDRLAALRDKQRATADLLRWRVNYPDFPESPSAVKLLARYRRHIARLSAVLQTVWTDPVMLTRLLAAAVAAVRRALTNDVTQPRHGRRVPAANAFLLMLVRTVATAAPPSPAWSRSVMGAHAH